MNQILSPLPTRPEPEKATSSERLPTSSFQVPHESAIAHVGGEAKFVDDLPSSKDEVWVDYIPSPSAHGKILVHNFEELKQIPGILGIFTFQDLPGNNHFGNIISDETFLHSHFRLCVCSHYSKCLSLIHISEPTRPY